MEQARIVATRVIGGLWSLVAAALIAVAMLGLIRLCEMTQALL